MRCYAVVLVCLALAGCATTKVMDGVMGSWVGAPVDEVVAQWGYPSDTRDFAGRKLYVWSESRQLDLPSTSTTTGKVDGYGNYHGTTTTTPGGSVAYSCERILEVDKDEVVTAYQWRGNNCPFAEAGRYKNWRRRGA